MESMDDYLYRDIIILYCPAKVGSTSLVTSLRLSAADKFMVFHTHEQKIADLLNDKVNIINVNDILKNNLFYNTKLNRYRKIYVIDIYITPM